MKWEEIEVGKFRSMKANGRSIPYVVAFVLHPQGRVVLKGMENEVETYIKQRYPIHLYQTRVCSESLLPESYRGRRNAPQSWTRGWTSFNSSIFVLVKEKVYPQKDAQFAYTRNRRTKRKVYEVTVHQNSGKSVTMLFRNFPKKWLPIYDTAAPRNRQVQFC